MLLVTSTPQPSTPTHTLDRYGFVSLLDVTEGMKAMKEMNGKYVGNRPCKLVRSNWEDRVDEKRLKKMNKGPRKNKKHIM